MSSFPGHHPIYNQVATVRLAQVLQTLLEEVSFLLAHDLGFDFVCPLMTRTLFPFESLGLGLNDADEMLTA